MSKIPRQSIISIAAIAGAQLANLVLPAAVQPGQTSSSCLQWASDAAEGYAYNVQRAINPPKVPAGLTEGEYNQYRQIFHTDDIRVVPAPTVAPHAAAPVAAPYRAAIAPAPTPTPTADPAQSVEQTVANQDEALDRQIAQANGMSVEQYRAHPELARADAGIGGGY